MSKEIKVQLETSSILKVPLDKYEQDFTFIVNGREFRTSRLISELLSPKICQYHAIDPTINKYHINTQTDGDFSKILCLVNFDTKEICEDELPFLSEVIEDLGNESIRIDDYEDKHEINKDNIFDEIHKCEKAPHFYSKRYEKCVEYLALHFFELCRDPESGSGSGSESENEIEQLGIDTLVGVIGHRKLRMKNEDQLLKLVNDLYSRDKKYSILYDYVLFVNATSTSICEFVNIFNINDFHQKTWTNICSRLKIDISDVNALNNDEARYEEPLNKGHKFSGKNDEIFNGIIEHLKKESNNNINSKINITSSTVNNPYYPSNVIEYEDRNKWFHSQNVENNWICFDFKDKRVIPTNYKIRSSEYSANSHNPKSWNIEGSNDGTNWEILSEERDSSFLNGKHLVHMFPIKNSTKKEFRYIRMRLTGPNWGNCNYFMLDSFELYGSLI